MTFLAKVLADFLDNIKTLPSSSDIISVLLGGSHVRGKTDRLSDIDILVICKEEASSTIFQEFQTLTNLNVYKTVLDVKIIDEEKIKFVNSSIQSHFFYHLVAHSRILYGEDYRSRFKLNTSYCYHAIIQKLD